MTLRDALSTEFDQELVITRRFLERLPEGELTYKPHEKSMTLGRLASHVAELAGWAEATMTTDSLDLAPVDGPRMQSWNFATKAELIQPFEDAAFKARAAFAETTDAALAEPWTLLMGGKALFVMPRAAVIRTMVINHMVHHRAQLGVYFRLLGVAVPATYGPSADEGNG